MISMCARAHITYIIDTMPEIGGIILFSLRIHVTVKKTIRMICIYYLLFPTFIKLRKAVINYNNNIIIRIITTFQNYKAY